MCSASNDRVMSEDDARYLVRLSVIGRNELYVIFLVQHCVARLSLREIFHCVRGSNLLVLSASEVNHIRGTARCHTIKTLMACVGHDAIEVDQQQNFDGPAVAEFIDIRVVGNLGVR